MPTKPSTLPEWATGGSAEISTPPSATQSTGWIAKIRPPHEWVNWFWNLAYQWLAWLDARTTLYTTLDELVAGLAVGETAELGEHDGASLPGSTTANFAAGGSVLSVATDARYLYVARAGVCTRYTRAGASTGVTYTPTNAGTIVRVVTNGDVVVLAYGNYVEAFEPTGASRWVVNHGAAVRDVCVTAAYVWAVGALSVNHHVKTLGVATGAPGWTFRHSLAGTVWSVASDGRSVFIAGTTSSYASGANVRALNASNGYDATGEDIGTDTAGLAWNAVAATDMISGATLAVDDQRLYLGYQSASTVESRSKLTGAVLSTVTPSTGITVVGLAIDQDFLVVGGSVDVALGLAKADLSTAWRYNGTGGGIVTTDGAAAWVAYGSTVYKVARGNRPQRWRRVDPDDLGLPFRWLAIPQR